MLESLITLILAIENKFELHVGKFIPILLKFLK